MKVLIGKKIGMTQVFDQETGKLTPVTAIDVSGNVVARLLNQDGKELVEVGLGKKKKASSDRRGQYKKIGFVPQMTFRSTRFDQVEEGVELNANLFEVGEKIDVIGTTKGKGFAGVMKRHGFKGGKRTHGQSDRDRAPGSIGSGTTPGRVLKGKKMAGRMGRDRQTIKNLKVISVDPENNLVTVSGSIPGRNKSYVVIKQAR